MTDYHINISPPTSANILSHFEHTAVGQQVAADIAANFSSVSDMMSHTTNAPKGAVTDLLTGDTVTFGHVQKPRLAVLARHVASYFGWNAA